jgi:hypothetical protein
MTRELSLRTTQIRLQLFGDSSKDFRRKIASGKRLSIGTGSHDDGTGLEHPSLHHRTSAIDQALMARRRLTVAERDEVARAGHERYAAGESWAEIARDLDLHPGSLRRIVMALDPVEFRRWGQRAVADPAEVAARRARGESIPAIAEVLNCSQTAVRTALESMGAPTQTRYPRLSTRRAPTGAELADLQRLYEACPEAQRRRRRSARSSLPRTGRGRRADADALEGAGTRTDLGALAARPARAQT